MSKYDDERDPTDWESPTPVGRIVGTGRDEGNAIQFSWWNLLLLVPLLMLITPLFNTDEPALFGMPYFYWYQFNVRLRRRRMPGRRVRDDARPRRAPTTRRTESGDVDPEAGR
jgi:hypothetical protein